MIITSKNIVVNGEFIVYNWARFSERLECLVPFSGFLSNKTQKPKNSTVCRHTFLLLLTIMVANYT